MTVLATINSLGGRMTKKTLIERLQSREYQMIPLYNPSHTKSAPHSRLRAILDPLEKHWHFVEIRSKGRKSEVSLTEQGASALKIFGEGKTT